MGQTSKGVGYGREQTGIIYDKQQPTAVMLIVC